MGWLIRLYRLINILSIDVAIGAMLSALFFGKLFDVKILPYGISALGLTVWIIYTADHLRDAKKIPNDASSERHRFHQKNFKLLVIFLVMASLIDGFLIFFIRKPVFIGGIVLTAFVALYLILQSRLFFMKETFVALLYTLGVLLPSWAVASSKLGFPEYALMIEFFLIAELNLMIFSFFDYDQDLQDGLSSFATRFGKSLTTRRIVIEFILLFGIISYQCLWVGLLPYNIILLLSSSLLLIIFSCQRFFGKHALYRFVGDAVFYLPGLILIYG
jgi:hypothetical protein